VAKDLELKLSYSEVLHGDCRKLNGLLVDQLKLKDDQLLTQLKHVELLEVKVKAAERKATRQAGLSFVAASLLWATVEWAIEPDPRGVKFVGPAALLIVGTGLFVISF
jgi:hypothetical protein